MDHFLVDRRANRRRVPVVALERRRRARPRESASPPAHPGRPSSRRAPRAPPVRSALRRPDGPASRIRSSSAADRQTITLALPCGSRLRCQPLQSPPPDPPPPVGRLRAVDRPERRPHPVVLDQRLRLRGGTPSAARARPTALSSRRCTSRPPHFRQAAPCASTGAFGAAVLADHPARRSRRTSSASGTTISSTISGSRPSMMPSSADACATVRGKPSSTNPPRASAPLEPLPARSRSSRRR